MTKLVVGWWGGGIEQVEIARTIAPQNHVLCWRILHRETKRLKFNDAVVVSSELINRNKIFENARSNKNTASIERTIGIGRRKDSMANLSDG